MAHTRQSEIIGRTVRPVTRPRMVRDLRALGVALGDELLVHTSLSMLGYVPGGAQAVVEALIESVGPKGLIVMPTFSAHLSDPRNRRNPPIPQAWHEETRAAMPAYEPRKSPTSAMGVINECFRSWPGTSRSAHPQHSFTAWGPEAASIVARHELEHAMDMLSPLGSLYEADAKVLLLGPSFANCTSFHLAECRSGKLPPLISGGSPMIVEGERRWVSFTAPNFQGDDFGKLGSDFEQGARTVSVGKVGEATCRLFRMRAAVDFAVDWLRMHRGSSKQKRRRCPDG
jgi:aminoglycoside 3-N-acetyltransferase